MRHWIFRAFRASAPSNNIFHLGELSQSLLDAVVNLVDLSERRLWGQEGLNQECSFVQLRHEVRSDMESENDGGSHNQKRNQQNELPVSQARVKKWGVVALQSPDNPHVFGFPFGTGAKEQAGDHRN